MKIITEADFRRQIKTQIAPGYLFFGEEDYLKSHAASSLRAEVCPDEAFAIFNCVKVSPLEYDPAMLVATMSAPPMMGERKFIELCGFNISKMLAEDFDVFCEVLSALADYDYNVLVLSVSSDCIDEGTKKKPNERFAKLCELLTPVRFEKCPPQKLALWAARHFEHNGVAASAAVCAKTVEYCGRDMYKLAGEIDKISFYVRAKGRDAVEVEDIIKTASPDTDYDTFAFANALTAGNAARALEILSFMKNRRIEPVFIMGQITAAFCDLMLVKELSEDGMGVAEISAATKMHSYKAEIYLNAVREVSRASLARMLDLCADADAAIKSSRGYEAIELLICSI